MRIMRQQFLQGLLRYVSHYSNQTEPTFVNVAMLELFHNERDESLNIYGMTTPIGDNEIWKALEMANIAKFVESLPHGLDEELTDGENMVSGGQLQRLHLAHLFCTWRDRDLVMLDECLSALDERSRDLMIDRLQEFLKGKTAIVITHHSEMLRMCDVVHDLTPVDGEQLLSPMNLPAAADHRRSSAGKRRSLTALRSSMRGSIPDRRHTFSHLPTNSLEVFMKD